MMKNMNNGAEAAASAVPIPRARWLSRIVLPLGMVASCAAVLMYASREALLPAIEVRIEPVIVRPLAMNASQDGGDMAPPTGGVLAQAPGWVEPEPFATVVQALVEGVVSEVLALEGERVEAGQVVARLIAEDAQLELDSALAEREMAQAALGRSQAEVDVAAARVAEVQDELDRKRGLVEIGGVSEGEFARLELRIRALKAAHAVAEAELRAAQAAVQRADVQQRKAALALARTTISAPVSGVVLSRSVVPGTRISMAPSGFGDGGMPGLIAIYDPTRLQVRAEVPLADFSKIAVGTRAEVTTEALPGVTVEGVVTRIVHEADIQRNTVQVKVQLHEPPEVLKPDMLMRVRFVGGGARAGEQGDGSLHADNGGVEVLAPIQAVHGEADAAFAWVAALSESGTTLRAERREIEFGGEVVPGFVQVLAGLQPGDRLIVTTDEEIKDGTRVREIQ